VLNLVMMGEGSGERCSQSEKIGKKMRNTDVFVGTLYCILHLTIILAISDF